MTIIDLIGEESAPARTKILATAALAGILNALALMVVNSAAQGPEEATIPSFLLFAPAAVLSIFIARRSSHQTNEVIESALHRIKTRLVEKVERADFERLESTGRSEILDGITENVTTISNAASGIGVIVQSLCVFGFGVVYLVSLSPVTFAILLPLQLAAFFLHRSRNGRILSLLKEQGSTRIRFLDTLMDLLRGAKEIRLNRARARDAVDELGRSSAELADAVARTNHTIDDSSLLMTANLYVILAAVVFVLPKHVELGPELTTKIVAALLFLWGSVEMGLATHGMYMASNNALQNIAELEEKLDSATSRRRATDGEAVDPWGGKLGRIEAKGIEYTYPAQRGEAPFRVGPLDLAVEPGEIVFIVGGNGSGKSTLLKILTGLYTPGHGTLTVGQIPVSPRSAEMYREMISVIFSDFHLFSRAYGLLDVNPEVVQGLLREMQIDHKTSFKDGEFTRQRLSTGQKKRLAMVVALLEDRPLLVLDEWAADQDPEFRKHFYESMLPTLRSRGKTVIAVSHDDRYFHVADRVVIMEYGTIRSVHVNERPRVAQ